MPSSIIHRSNLAIAALVGGLSDPVRGRRYAMLTAAVYGAAWWLYGIVAKSSQDINADLGEMVVWGRELALGYPKHPPLVAYVTWAWFGIFPAADWAFLLLAALTLAAGLYLAFELCALWLSGEKLATVPFLLGVIPFYNFFGIKFDQSSALLPLWALAMLAFMRALAERSARWAVILGIAAAAAVLTKYWSCFLLAAMAAALLFDQRRDAYLRSSAPWLSAAVFLALTLPHIVWLIDNRALSSNWIAERMTHSAFDFFRSAGEYTFGTIGYAAPALILVVLAAFPSIKAIRDSWFVTEPGRRPAMFLFWVPLLLPIPIAALNSVNLVSRWNEASLSLLPVMMLASPLVLITASAARLIAVCAVTYTLAALIASPVVALVLLKRGVENDAAYTRLAAMAAEREWRATTSAPLHLVAGTFAVANSAAFYLSDKPSSYEDFGDGYYSAISEYLSPWVTGARIAREGIAIICDADDDRCLADMDKLTAAGPAGRRGEVVLTRHWLGLASAPKRFVIATVPPRP